jgi:hypothetical protein
VQRRLNDDALLAYARFGIEAGTPGPKEALKLLRTAGFSCGQNRMDWAWQRAVTIPTHHLTVMVDLPGRHPWATDPPKRLVVLDGSMQGDAALAETTVVVVTRTTTGLHTVDYFGEPEVN